MMQIGLRAFSFLMHLLVDGPTLVIHCPRLDVC